MAMGMDFKTSGPLFDGRLEKTIDDGLQDSVQQVADKGVSLLRMQFGEKFKHPTGRYEHQVHVQRVGDDRIINDNYSVYGPWLEGTGSRNRTTRFKGYRSFQIIRQKLASIAGPMTERIIGDRIERL